MRRCVALALLLTVLCGSSLASQTPAAAPGTVKLRVLDCNGGPISRCKVALLRAFPQRPGSFGKVPEFADRALLPRDFDGDCATLSGLPNGEFVFQVEAELHALARSVPFRIGGDEQVSEVRVKLTRGAILSGTVLGADGKPLAGAAVHTEAVNGLERASDFGKIFAQFVVTTVTQTATTTDAKGHFTLEHLASGNYRVVTVHPDFCEADVETEVAGDQQLQLADLQLQRGTNVEGKVTCAGMAEAGLRVQVSKPPATGQPPIQATATALTDASGCYRFDRRLPPGTYQIHACKPGQNNNPFGMLLQIQATQRDLVIEPGKDKVVQDFDIPKK